MKIMTRRGSLLYEDESPDIRSTVERANHSGLSLFNADLRDASLSKIRLFGVNLAYADLRGADLSDATMIECCLNSAIFDSASLNNARLYACYLTNAYMSFGYFRGTSFERCCLRKARIARANFSLAQFVSSVVDCDTTCKHTLTADNFIAARDDLWSLLSVARASEVQAIRDAIITGRVDGDTYTGACTCPIGIIQKLQGPDSGSAIMANGLRPLETFFRAVHPGDTPETSFFSALALGWIDEWTAIVKENSCP